MKLTTMFLAACLLSACSPCNHKNSAGQCMSDDDYLKMIAHDQAYLALVEFTQYCNSHPDAPACAVFKHN